MGTLLILCAGLPLNAQVRGRVRVKAIPVIAGYGAVASKPTVLKTALLSPALAALPSLRALPKVSLQSVIPTPVPVPVGVHHAPVSGQNVLPVSLIESEAGENSGKAEAKGNAAKSVNSMGGVLSEPDRISRFFDGSAKHSQSISVQRAPSAVLVPAREVSAERSRVRSGGLTKPTKAYLAETQGKEGPELLRALRHAANRGAKSLGYKEARRVIFSKADSEMVHGIRGVRGIYSQVFVPGKSGDGTKYKERGDQNGDGYVDNNGMNIEHTWPQSYFGKRSPMVSDLHHLFPTFEHPNSERSRLPFGMVSDRDVEYKTDAGARMGGGYFEPPDVVKGKVARAMLYFFARYYDRPILPRGVMNRFWNGRIETFLRWNRQFPPTPQEMRRNDVIEKEQGNRNPFIDDPSLADRLGAETLRMEGASSIDTYSPHFRAQAYRVPKSRKNKKKRGHRKKKNKHRR